MVPESFSTPTTRKIRPITPLRNPDSDRTYLASYLQRHGHSPAMCVSNTNGNVRRNQPLPYARVESGGYPNALRGAVSCRFKARRVTCLFSSIEISLQHDWESSTEIAVLIASQKYIKVIIHGVYVAPNFIGRGKGAKKAVTRKSSNVLHR